MRYKIIYLFILSFFSLCAVAQIDEYNKKGDKAFNQKDYREAKMWYEEGVSKCDPYSINQCTKIWLAAPSMRPSMRSLMNKCLTCLNVRATEKDTTAMSSLITYYDKGIGSTQNTELKNYWTQKLRSYRNQKPTSNQNISTPKTPMHVFIAYTYATNMPYGLTLGEIRGKIGWYVRYRTNLSAQSSSKICSSQGMETPPSDGYYKFDNEQKNNYTATVGTLFRIRPQLYGSAGLGYGKHQLMWHQTTYSFAEDKKIDEGWCENVDAAKKGMVVDLELNYTYRHLFLSIGGYTLNFKNTGINASFGVIF